MENRLVDLEQLYDSRLIDVLFSIAEAANQQNMLTYLVGGTVRDFVLNKTSQDIDLVFVGPAIEFFKNLYKNWSTLFGELPQPGKPLFFKKYGTGKLNFQQAIGSGISTIDFASARSETYPVSGGAPIVAPANLDADLFRRDFSINAMAILLRLGRVAELYDPYHGTSDLDDRVLRVLHDKSFIDDPIRLIRGVRFIVRFELVFAEDSRKLFDEAVAKNYLSSLPVTRLFDEFRKVLEEERKFEILSALERHGLLRQIHPDLILDGIDIVEFQQLSWQQSFRVLLKHLSQSDFEKTLKRFGVSDSKFKDFA